jgi:hypothetical protein
VIFIKVYNYNRENAVNYAFNWAYLRNPNYLDFTNFGGDCTNFISQCLYAGSGIMNYRPTFGWFYINSYRRSPSWSGVQYLHNFLISNKETGPFATSTDISRMQLGDVIQLGDANGRFYHSLLVTEIDGVPSLNTIKITTHTLDSNLRSLNTYKFAKIRFLHIEGVRK